MNKMVKMLLIAAGTSAALMSVSEVSAQSAQERIQQIIDGADDADIVDVISDENGNLKSFKCYGTGVLRKGLPKAIRVKRAAESAKTSARSAAANFFNTKVKWQRTESGETVGKTIGSSEGDSEGVSRSEDVDTNLSSQQQHECSEAALSGLVKIGSGENAHGLYVVVLAWSNKTSSAAASASKTMGKVARQSITEAKAAEGASLQDPNEAYRNAAAKDAAEEAADGGSASEKSNANGRSSSRNSAPVIKTTVAPGAEDFF